MRRFVTGTSKDCLLKRTAIDESFFDVTRCGVSVSHMKCESSTKGDVDDV